MRAARTASKAATHMTVPEYDGDGEPMGNVQLGQYHHPRADGQHCETELGDSLLFGAHDLLISPTGRTHSPRTSLRR